MLVGALSLLPPPHAAEAAFPMMEDFYIGSGSKIRPSNKEMEEMVADYERSWQLALESPLRANAQRALEKLAGVDALLKDSDLDGARAILSTPDIITIGLKITPKKRMQVQGPWAACSQDAKCGEGLEDARAALQQLEEWCFENRVEFYNSADQKQVMAREGVGEASARIKAAINEPLELAEQGREALRRVLATAS